MAARRARPTTLKFSNGTLVTDNGDGSFTLTTGGGGGGDGDFSTNTAHLGQWGNRAVFGHRGQNGDAVRRARAW